MWIFYDIIVIYNQPRYIRIVSKWDSRIVEEFFLWYSTF